jgi:hypothetical protein
MMTLRLVSWGLFLSQLFASGTSLTAQSGTDSTVVSSHPAAGSLREDSLCGGDYPSEESSWLEAAHYFPLLFRDRSVLEKYIRDPRFQSLRRNCGDTMAVDLIFARAVEIADGSMGYALLIAALATFDHFRIGVIVPLIGVISVPLGLESRDDYRVRYANLPRMILPDSLGKNRRDRDKLQHFFGSAYLTYAFNSPFVAHSIGDFVEWGEPRFIVGGDYDERDKYANRLGREFGKRLLEGDEVIPSDILWGGESNGK